MILAYRKSRNTLIAMLLVTAVLTALILLLHKSGFDGERELLAVIVASLGFFISISVSRLIMNSEILSLRYMLTNAIKLDKCAAELERASRKMKRKSEDRFQTAAQAADAMSMIGRMDDAVDLIISTASENPTPEHTTQALISALRYSLLKGDMSVASDYAAKARKAVEGLGNGIGKGIYDKELRIFESFLSGEETMLTHRYHTAETELIKLEAAMLLSDSNDIALKDECVRFISEPREDKL